MKLRNLTTALLLSLGLTLTAAQPRYVFYFIGDGMGVGAAMAGQTYNSVALGNPDRLLMTQFPVAGMVETYSANRRVTDSAAAGTALATGHKTRNGMVGVTPDSVAVASIAETLHNDGWGVALVTTVAPDDATPAAFYAHVPSRKNWYRIGRQAAESGYEFIAGSNWRGIEDRHTHEPTDLMEYIASHDVDIVTSTAAARDSKSRRVFLYSEHPFYSDNAGFTIDSVETALKLPDMTATAIDHMLRVSPDRFFMMVEGGNIDHVAHGNDGPGVAVEVYNFNEALRHAYDFYLQHPHETLIVVTADHETGGMSIGNDANRYYTYMETIPLQRMSKDMFSTKVWDMTQLSQDQKPTWEQFKDYVSEKTGLWRGVRISLEQEEAIRQQYVKTFETGDTNPDQETLYATFNALTQTIFDIVNENMGFGWTTTGHSGNPVPLYAIGEGTEILGTLNDNTDVAPKLLEIIQHTR